MAHPASSPAIIAIGRKNSEAAHRKRVEWYEKCHREKSRKECWVWPWTVGLSTGYGVFNRDKRVVMAHRFSYEHFIGPIPDGLVLDHLCRNRQCVNPWHLEVVTRAENTMRSPIHWAAKNKAKTHCKHGHEFTPENTAIDAPGGRQCRACSRRTPLAHYHKGKGSR